MSTIGKDRRRIVRSTKGNDMILNFRFIALLVVILGCGSKGLTNRIGSGQINRLNLPHNVTQYQIITSAGYEIAVDVDRDGQLIGIYTSIDDSTRQFLSFHDNRMLKSKQLISDSGAANGKVYNFSGDAGALKSGFTVRDGIPFGISKTYYEESGMVHKIAYLDDEGRYYKMIVLSPTGDTISVED